MGSGMGGSRETEKFNSLKSEGGAEHLGGEGHGELAQV